MHKQVGAVVILFIMMLPVLLMMMALALDTGNLFVARTELQNAADACALSAATELNGTPAQFNSAQAAGLLAGNSNRFNFQKGLVGSANGASIAVTFDTVLNGAFTTTAAASPANPANFRFVRCVATGAVNKFLVVPGLGNSDALTARAIASNVPAASPCVLPVSICNTAINAATPVGMWLGGQLGNGGNPNAISPVACNGTNGPNCSCNGGSCFRWAHFGPGTGNAAELANLLTGNNSCGLNLAGQLVSENVPVASTFNEYNTRFGVQQGANPVKPDFTGFGYKPASFPASNNAYPNYVAKRTSLTKYQGSLPGYTIVQPTAANATARRIGIAPVVNCATPGPQTVTEWRCILMLNPVAPQPANNRLYLEFMGAANSGACALIGSAGGVGPGPTVSALVQ